MGPSTALESQAIGRGDQMPKISTKELMTLKIAKRSHHTLKSRLLIVQCATEHGLTGAARRFDLDWKTVPVSRHRWHVAGLVGLVPPLSPDPRAPHCGLDRGMN